MQVPTIATLSHDLLTLLDALVTVDDLPALRQFMALWHRHMPDGARTLLVLGNERSRRQPADVLANHGWSPRWIEDYRRGQFHKVDPVWNAPIGQLIYWSRLLVAPASSAARRSYVLSASAEQLNHGLSWLEQAGEYRIVLSIAGDVEHDARLVHLMTCLAPKLMAVLVRILTRTPNLTGLSRQEWHILQGILCGQTDVITAHKLGISVRTVREKATKIRRLNQAVDRVDLVRRLWALEMPPF